MEKVKLTQEQADEIRSLYDDLKDELSMSIDEFIDDHANDGGYKPLNDLNISVSLLAKYFYIGCEIKPEFKVGDFVHVTWSNTNPGIYNVVETGVRSVDGDWNGVKIDWFGHPNPSLDIIRHATPEEIAQEKERRWWKSHNRDVWELRESDILSIDGYENVTMVVKEVIHENITLLNGEDEEYMFLYDIKNLLSVVCFAEDRKDV